MFKRKPKTVIIASEDLHGDIIVAADVPSAIDFIITHLWIGGGTEVYDIPNDTWVPLDQKYGKDWEKKIRAMNLKEFNETFEETFYLREEEIYTK